jgi:niacin transporter
MILGRMVNAIVLLLMARLFNMNVPAPLSVLASSLRGMPGILIQLLLVPGIVIAIYSSQEKYIQ